MPFPQGPGQNFTVALLYDANGTAILLGPALAAASVPVAIATDSSLGVAGTRILSELRMIKLGLAMLLGEDLEDPTTGLVSSVFGTP